MRKRSWFIPIVVSSVTLLGCVSYDSYRPSTQAQAQQVDTRFFPQTGHTVKGRFLQYWDQHGGLSQQGFPISEEMREASQADGKTYTVQYFERAVFELHPENQPPNDVLLSLLGVFQYRQKYPNGAPAQTTSTDNPYKFTETGYTVGGKFRDYWESHGGLAQQGYPISDEFQEKSSLDGKTYTVQYFERAVFELHPENAGTPYEVLLSQLGSFEYKALYDIQMPSVPDPSAGHWRSHLGGSDHYLVWQDEWHLPDANGFVTSDIMGLDVKTNKTFVVANAQDNHSNPQFFSSHHNPQISGSLVVWEDESCSAAKCEYDILGKDLATGTIYQIATGPGYRNHPAIAGRTVIWIEGAEEEKLLAMDLNTNTIIQVTSAFTPTSAVAPLVSDEYIVWSQKGQVDEATSTVPIQLVAYDRKTGKTTTVDQYTQPSVIYSYGGPEGYSFALGDHYVVWQDGYSMTMADLSTGKISLLTADYTSGPTNTGDILILGAHGFTLEVVDLKEGNVKYGKLDDAAVWPAIAGDWVAWLSPGQEPDAVHIHFKLLRKVFAAH